VAAVVAVVAGVAEVAEVAVMVAGAACHAPIGKREVMPGSTEHAEVGQAADVDRFGQLARKVPPGAEEIARRRNRGRACDVALAPRSLVLDPKRVKRPAPVATAALY
jgi:hypothetical protein